MINTNNKNLTWQNCWADVGTCKYSHTLQYYMQDVVEPALSSIEARIQDYIKQGGAWEAFAVHDMKIVRLETTLAFSLAIQSIWERQLREYLHNCVVELKPDRQDLLQRAESNRWNVVESLFVELRGMSLDAFTSYSVLSTLHLLGNAARHGKGDSFNKLKKSSCEFWPQLFPGDYYSLVNSDQIVVTIEHLHRFSDAICAFWDEVEIIRLRSLKSNENHIIEKIDERIAQSHDFG